MKNLILFIAAISITFSVVAKSKLTDYVVINKVKWATRNVAAPGTFTAKAEDVGMIYQWNSKIAWTADGQVTKWDNEWNGGYDTPSVTDSWSIVNDPSPAGYRLPTYAEIKRLVDTTKVKSVWTTQNGVNGRKFTDKTSGNSIFVPASGYRLCFVGTLIGAGYSGNYWSSTANSSTDAYYLSFSSGYAGWGSSHYSSRAYGRSVRPVAE